LRREMPGHGYFLWILWSTPHGCNIISNSRTLPWARGRLSQSEPEHAVPCRPPMHAVLRGKLESSSYLLSFVTGSHAPAYLQLFRRRTAVMAYASEPH